MDAVYPASQYELLTRPIVNAWVGMIDRAANAKKEFIEQADMCEAFYRKSSGFMWQKDFRTKYIGANVPVPQYEVTVNTAFEFVSRFAPRLYWQNPRRRVTRPAQPQLNLGAVFGGDDPMLLEQMQQQQAMFDARASLSNELWETYLDYTPHETPGGGLEQHSLQAINEALVTGRGMLVPRTYTPPGSDRVLTGCFFKTVRDLYVDPDCSHPLLMGAKWIALRHVTPYWELEKRFGWPKGSLRNKGQYESGASQGSRPKQKPGAKDADTPKDLVEWYEIWSKAGIGARFINTQLENKEAWDDIGGDYVYLCITPNVKSPLNMPAWWLEQASDEDVLDALKWPVEFWKDGRWPVSLLDFYPNFNGCWPLAPLSAAMGEMICLQILLAIYLQNAQANTQQILAYLDSAASQVEAKLKSGDPIITVKLVDGLQKNINEVVQFLNRPSMNTDIVQAMEFLMRSIERKTGLSALIYGENPEGTVSRSAADITAKQQNVTIIPDFMAKQVAAWQGDVADKERITACAARIGGQSLMQLLGPAGALAWDRIVLAEDEETVLRGMRCRVEASDMKKPDKSRDAENLNQIAGYEVPALMQYGQATGDFGPWNGFHDELGRAMEIDTSRFRIPDQQPQGDPAAEQKAQLEQQKLEADQQAKEADSQRKERESEGKLQAQAAKIDLDRQQAEQKMAMTEDQHAQKMDQNQQIFWQRMQGQQAQQALKLQQQRAIARNGSSR